jgi:outer membrane protein assembly factor BamA
LNNKASNIIFFKSLLIFAVIVSFQIKFSFSQVSHKQDRDTVIKAHTDYKNLDSLKLFISDIIISGNNITQDEIILREMQLGKGKVFLAEQCDEDQAKIYNLGLFTRVEISPELQSENNVRLHVNVEEKWYLFPMPAAGLVDGELRKLWVGANVRWQNFRGRNERVSLNFGLGYNSFVRATYSIPWIGEDLHFFTNISGGYSIERNRSFLALGRTNGYTISNRRDSNNFDYNNYSVKLTFGKYFSRKFSVYSDVGYTLLKVNGFAPGRTLSSDGSDRYLLMGLGLNLDSRNNREYTMSGYYLNANYQHFGLISDAVNFGRFTFEQQSFLPVNIKNDYSITFASKLFSSVVVGSTIPDYNHRIMGNGDDYVRGWYRFGFEGDNEFAFYNEFRIPLIQPDYLKVDNLPVLKNIKYLKKFSYKYGLFLTLFYDLGGVWNEDDKVSSIKMMNGTGIGLNAILPFGIIGKLEWAMRLGNPTVGQVVLGFGAKF